MINSVVIVGNLGQDPEVRYSAQGLPIANLNLAVSEFWKNPQGETEKRTHWFRATAFGKTAELAQQYLRKGSRVGIQGSLVQRSWEDQQSGQKRSSVEVRVNNLEFLSSAQNGGQSGGRGQEYDGPMPSDSGYDEIPF